MKRIIPLLICVLLGVGVGWYWGYTRPALQAMHMYRDMKKTMGFSDEEMLRAAPEAFAKIKREDESVAMVALRGSEILDRGDTQAAKKYLAYWVGSYYRVYHANGDTNLIAHIEQAATTNAEIASEIAKKVQ
jgi:hypothetical protein